MTRQPQHNGCLQFLATVVFGFLFRLPHSAFRVGGVMLLLAAPVVAEPSKAPRTVDYAKDVQPLFSTHCYACHGEKKQLAGLRLDRKADALRGGESGKALVPGKGADSLLVKLVKHLDAERKMPSKQNKLSDAQIATLETWIDQGAVWPDRAAIADPRQHWAFKTPVKPAVPKVAGGNNAIDAFIRAKLEQEKLKPAPEADKLTLLRRLYLDLIGLPPTVKEIDAFLADTSKDAYAKVVEQLLQSPHYGERWGRHWLDAARYADSDGYEKDKSRQVWFYRDWVIHSLNSDKPYDRFLLEQLAGDLLPSATQDQIVATGFLRHSMLNEEGGVDPEQFRMDAMFDRMDAFGKAMLGLTLNCCQCHNHKYDPISQEEYYRLFAYLNNDYEAQRVVYTPEEQLQIATIRREIAALEAKLQHTTPDWQARQDKWEAALPKQATWQTLTLENAGDNGQRYLPQKDGSILAQGYAPTKFSTHLKGAAKVKNITGIRLELLNHPDLPCNGPGRSYMGTCALTEFTAEGVDPKTGKKTPIKFVAATADYSNPERELEANFFDKSKDRRVTGPIGFAIDGKVTTAWGIDAGPGRRNVPRTAVFVPEKPVTLEDGMELHLHLQQSHGGWNSDDHMNNNLGCFRLSVTTDANPSADPFGTHVRTALAAAKRNAAQQATIFSAFRTSVPEWKAENDKIEELYRTWPKGSTTLTLMGREDMRDTKMLKRGDFLKPGKSVGAGVPSVLHPLPDPKADSSRLTLANWLVSKQSPTTARVFVNRVWQAYFGTGIVSTSEDFGTQSDKPSHPELLDWLAVEFMERKWSIKELHRLIVHSATYKQSSHTSDELQARDPYNRLLARASRLRVDGEIVRDIALQASGLLNPTVGGASLFTPAPAFLFVPPASYGPFTWTDVTGADKYRRAIYTFRRRSTPYPVFTNFDVPNGDSSCVKRTRSNTPLQALTTLNEVLFMDCARALATRTLKDGGKNDEARITYAFRTCLTRSPTKDERDTLQGLLMKTRGRIATKDVHAIELATGTKDGKLPAGMDAEDMAAYTVLARVLLNLDETITKE